MYKYRVTVQNLNPRYLGTDYRFSVLEVTVLCKLTDRPWWSTGGACGSAMPETEGVPSITLSMGVMENEILNE